MHNCPCGCKVQITVNRLSCRTSWYLLPKELRSKIWEYYSNGEEQLHRKSISEAYLWFKENQDKLREKGVGYV